ncbi:MAG: hypothetical protein EOL88_10860 [Bacteroidia bacterium]|nr:hypothetical protein [Bacteroidia bacterium]
MNEIPVYKDPFLREIIHTMEDKKAPDGFVFSVMRAVEQSPSMHRQGFSGEQLLSVILLGAAASVSILFVLFIPMIFNTLPEVNGHNLAAILPIITKVFFSLQGMMEAVRVPALFGVSVAVILLLIGIDVLFRSGIHSRRQNDKLLAI